jgi:hypothetical protein
MRHALFLVMLVACSSKSAPSTQNLGIISLDSQSYSTGGQTYGSGSVTATFLRQQPTDPFAGCSKKTFDTCAARFACGPVLGQPVDDAGTTPYASAGDLTVGGLSMPITLSVMSGGTFPGQYSAFQQYTPLFTGGESLTVSAAGGEVGAFHATVTAPQQPTITAPDGTQPISVAKGQDLTFTWSGGASGVLRVQMTQPTTSGAPGLDCTFPLAGGSGKIPSNALGVFATGQASIGLSVASTAQPGDGDWQVQVAATTVPLLPNGEGFAVSNVNLQ